MTTLRRVLTCERGYSLIELLQVTAILGVVLTGLTALFLQATKAELDMNRRFQAQQSARLAVD
jgi:prepilin-type N-terminal cleavage/methylation domain-containing protein